MKMKKHVALIATLCVLQACKTDFESIQYTSGDADFSRTVALGGSFLAGYQNGALTADDQRKSIPALVTQSFNLAGGADFNQPLLPEGNGLGLTNKPWQSPYRQAQTLGYVTDCKGETSLFPIEHPMSAGEATPYLQLTGTASNDFSIPFATTSDLIDPSFGLATRSPYFHRFTNGLGATSAFDEALRMNPSFAIVWTGMDDIYNYAMSGGTSGSITSAAVLGQTLEPMLQKLTNGGAKAAIANIPDIEVFPFFKLVSPRALVLTLNQADSLNALTGSIFDFQEGENGFIVQDASAAFGYRQMTMSDRMLLSVPLDSVKCHFLGVIPADMPNRYVLDSLELADIKKNIAAYNSAIAGLAAKYDLALVDMYSFFQELDKGIAKDGVHYSTEFIKGGFFSLDAYHPNQKGYAILADEFIRSINAKFGSNLPETHCKDCRGVRFP